MYYVVYYKKVDETKFHVAGSFEKQHDAQETMDYYQKLGYRTFYKKQWYKPQNN